MIRRVWSAVCDDVCFTDVLYTFAETMYISDLGAVGDLCSYYVVCVWCTSSSLSAVFQCESAFPEWSLIFRFRDQSCEPISAVNLVYVNRDVIRALVRTRFVSLAEFDRLVLKIF
jgi:hypothetical protein